MNANQQIAAQLTLLRRGQQWWIVGSPELEEMGGYRTRAEANEDRRGVQRFLRNCHSRNFVTVTR